MSDFTNNLTAAELERLAILGEYMGEAQVIIGKIIRHGYESYNPNAVQLAGVAPITNRELLEKELGKVSAAINFMNLGGDIERDAIQGYSIRQMKTANRWLHHFQLGIPQEN